MQLFEEKLIKTHGYEEGKIDALDQGSANKALGYKKNVLKNLTNLSQDDIFPLLRGNEYYVTRKYDGEYAIIFHSNGQTVAVNRSGRTRRRIPCIEEAGRLLEQAGVKEGVFPAEMYVDAGYKTKVNDLVHALAHEDLIGTLKLAVFDMIEMDGQTHRSKYDKTWMKINEIFGSGHLCHPVDMAPAFSSREIMDIYRKWVETEGSEGLVIHSAAGKSYKVKPRHFIDVVVIAYAEGSGVEVGQVRSMLTAFIPKPGYYQVLSRVASGLNEKLRRKLYKYFQSRKVGNAFRGVNTKYEAMQMVSPELVIEMSVGDIITEVRTGERMNYLLRLDDKGYVIDREIKGYKFYAPVFIRIREDKSADEHDVSPAQMRKHLHNTSGHNTLLLKDVLFKGHLKRIFRIWQKNDGSLAYQANLNGQRTLLNDHNLLELFHHYEQDVSLAFNEGYIRLPDSLVVADNFTELLYMSEMQ